MAYGFSKQRIMTFVLKPTARRRGPSLRLAFLGPFEYDK